jgi:hypothetical protein
MGYEIGLRIDGSEYDRLLQYDDSLRPGDTTMKMKQLGIR